MSVIKIACFMLNFLNLKSFPLYFFFVVASSLSILWRNLLQSNFHSIPNNTFHPKKDWIFRKYLKKILEHKNSLATWNQVWSHCVQLRSLGGIQVQFFGPPMIWGFPSNLSYEVRLYIQSVVCNSWA